MSFTYVRVGTVSPYYLEDFFKRHPGLEQRGYTEQHAALMADAHFWANHLTRNLTALGAKAYDLVHNAEPLQEAWAREHGSKGTGWDLVVEQLNALKPEVVFLNVYYPMYAELVELVRAKVPTVRLIHGNIGVGFGPEHFDLFRSLDFIIACESGLNQKLIDAGATSHHIFHGFEHTLLPRIQKRVSEPDRDALFTGSLVLSKGYHLQRLDLLLALVDQGLDFDIRSRPVEARAKLPEALGAKVRPAVFGLNMFCALAGAKTTINVHIDAVQSASNLRLFEATGAGTCLVTDEVPGLSDLFEPDVEVVTYSTPKECAQKVRWLIDHPAERKAIAKAGQKRTLKDHRLEQRAEELYSIITTRLGEGA